MKFHTLLFNSLLLTTGIAPAAITLSGGDTNNGLANAAGTSAISSGTLRFGIFTGGYTPLSTHDFATINSNFVEVYSFSGPINASGDNGFYTLNASYNEALTYGGLPYDNSPGSTANVAGDIAGSNIYLWALNNVNPVAANEHLIFSSNALWGDANSLDPFNNIIPTSFSWESTAPGLTAHIGSIASVDSPVYPSMGINAHQMTAVAAVPEPSRAMLGFFGIAAMLFRRRRA